MQKTAKRYIKIGSIALLSPVAALALFGFGDVVFDPTSYATLGNIWSSDVSLLAKAEQTLSTTERLYQNGMQIYNLGASMAMQMSGRAGLSTVATQFVALQSQNAHGETRGWDAAANGRGDARSAWDTAARALPAVDFLATSHPGSSGRMANLASYELAQGASLKCLQTTGNQGAANVINSIARYEIQRHQFSQDGGDNTYMAQQNLANMGQAHMVNLQVDTNQQMACLALQQTVTSKIQADQIADSLNIANDMAQAKQRSSWAIDPDSTTNGITLLP